MKPKSISRRFKVGLSLLLIGLLWWKVYWQRGLDVTWHADIEETVNGITEVPRQWAERYTLADYRKQVRDVCSNLTITLHSNGTATLQGGLFPANDAVWRRDDKFDYWVQSGGGWWTSSTGHGFTCGWWGKAHLKYSMEWNEDRPVVREFIVMRR